VQPFKHISLSLTLSLRQPTMHPTAIRSFVSRTSPRFFPVPASMVRAALLAKPPDAAGLASSSSSTTTSSSAHNPTPLSDVLASQRESKRDRVVVLGSGWAGFQVVRATRVFPETRTACFRVFPLTNARPSPTHKRTAAFPRLTVFLPQTLDIDKKIPFTVVSPSNHFVFTPLLASTAVGTLEFRCIQEPIRTHLGPKGGFLQAKARTLDPVRKTIVCESVDNDLFEIAYDKLVIAVGVKTNTFGIESIKQAEIKGDGVFFLKRLAHARAIRTHIIACFERAALPHLTDAERRRLLSFVVVGGGPTSCEFTAELHGACEATD
jgi:Pyridine nucleotide-disulphide oxidoreductase